MLLFARALISAISPDTKKEFAWVRKIPGIQNRAARSSSVRFPHGLLGFVFTWYISRNAGQANARGVQ